MRNQQGSVLLTTLVMAFIISLLMLGMTLVINNQARANRLHLSQQTSLAEIERFAEETYAAFSPLMNHDGTLNDTHLPGKGTSLITGSTQTVHCTRDFTADPSNVEVGFITVVMRETCDTDSRRSELTYQLSPDTDSVHSLLPAEPTQPLRITRLTTSASTPRTIQVTVTSTEAGYIRAYTESPDPNSLQKSYLRLPNHAVSAGGSITFTFPDIEGLTPSQSRRLKLLYSETPFSSTPIERIRRNCGISICGAQSILRADYTPTGTLTIITPPTLP